MWKSSYWQGWYILRCMNHFNYLIFILIVFGFSWLVLEQVFLHCELCSFAVMVGQKSVIATRYREHFTSQTHSQKVQELLRSCCCPSCFLLRFFCTILKKKLILLRLIISAPLASRFLSTTWSRSLLQRSFRNFFWGLFSLIWIRYRDHWKSYILLRKMIRIELWLGRNMGNRYRGFSAYRGNLLYT